MTATDILALLKSQWVNIVFLVWLIILTVVFGIYTTQFLNATSSSTTTVANGTVTSASPTSGAAGTTSTPVSIIMAIKVLTGINILLLIILFVGSWYYLSKNLQLEERPYILTMLHTSIAFSIISLTIICLKKINSKPS